MFYLRFFSRFWHPENFSVNHGCCSGNRFQIERIAQPRIMETFERNRKCFVVSFTDVCVVSIWILRMRVIWLHHIVVVWLLWSLWAYCIKGGKTRVTKSRFVQVLNLIGLEGGANFLDQSHDEVKQNQSNHRSLSTLNSKIPYYMQNATLKIETRCSNIFAGSGFRC